MSGSTVSGGKIFICLYKLESSDVLILEIEISEIGRKRTGSLRASTVFQSTLFLVDVIARRVHQFPVSPIELTTVAYVLCGILTYGFCWCKPKDMATPVIVPLWCYRQDMQNEIEYATNVKSENGFILPACMRNDSVSALSELYHERKLLDTLLASATWLNEEMARQEHTLSSIKVISDECSRFELLRCSSGCVSTNHPVRAS
jgi:hypothetical protein